ncbi:MAG TPA: hypothetical protein VGH27_19650 [Streptosporangiaceae bacterium]|jgi:hypothetical protein
MKIVSSGFSRSFRLLAIAAAAVPVLALAPSAVASAAVRPDGSARNLALRDNCGGANSNANWSSSAISTWGEVWDDSGCKVSQEIILEYDTDGTVYYWYSPTAAPGQTIGFNSGTLSAPRLTFAAEESCGGGQCSGFKFLFD